MNKFDIPDSIQKWLQSTVNRRRLLEKCGKDAYLDPDNLKYPVKNFKTCKYTFPLVHAAYVRAKQYKHFDIVEKAKKLLKSKFNYEPEE